ncbi:hypothetical protein ACFWTE_27675 [Nocardiopsis sp. NPDC058631]|uniref:hypothetical protein n=1 Tax=Nocardiopsis sp. NPDC058631 TaxID=3346566 RepID=UPI00365F5F15
MGILEEKRNIMEEILCQFRIGTESCNPENVEQGIVLAVSLHAGGGLDPLPSEEKEAFRSRVAYLLKSERNFNSLISYMSQCEHYSRMSKLDGFKRSCQIRSNLQILNDEFVPLNDVLSPADLETLDDAEDTYRENADDIPPVPEEEIPAWIPDSHWWWRVPIRKDMSQQEIDERLHYDWNDGLES